MESVIISEELLKKLISKSVKELFVSPDTLLDLEHMMFIDNDCDQMVDEVRVEIPIREGDIPDVTSLINSLDVKEEELGKANNNLEVVTKELQLMREFLAYKGVKFDRDWKNKASATDNEQRN